MNKLFVLLLLAAAAAGVYWWKYQRPVEKRVCARLTTLCGDDDDGDARERTRCEKDFAELERTASPETMKRLDQCLADAKSCVEGGGCVVGTGLSVAGDVFQQFGRGVSHALGN